ncbi:hypothetical protein A1O3_07013 [Capronia epimyces CBS 606.96]|uniref:Uncharacterized protein n=1 Tax=Capronia epimyces CBS 606.96 TaxID=1182542 RepID=W9YEJ8_9EURO|nr:uncharacterized protein A1O3_07013 [Capronia epimyces CBS 606.96]EXJ80729.1 hypothetical protein A1O3_07013 [Capronia epimyces CBS 606.96]
MEYSRKLQAQLRKDIAALSTTWTSLVVKMATRLLGPTGFEDFDFSQTHSSAEEEAIFNQITNQLLTRLAKIVAEEGRGYFGPLERLSSESQEDENASV